MNPIPKRVVIYPKDVVNITGRGDRTARKLLTKIRKKFNKQKGSFVTIEEFCSYTGINAEVVSSFLI